MRAQGKTGRGWAEHNENPGGRRQMVEGGRWRVEGGWGKAGRGAKLTLDTRPPFPERRALARRKDGTPKRSAPDALLKEIRKGISDS